MSKQTFDIVTAVARANIALVKYWGKRNEELRLPVTDSLGLTLDGLETHTSVRFEPGLERDRIAMDGVELAADDPKLRRISGHLDRMRKWTGRTQYVRMATQNSFPTGAGLASSASGLMALTYAVAVASGAMHPDRMSTEEWQKLSRWARVGSGSACRCAFGGFVQWAAGEEPDGSDSIAIPVANADYWPELRLVVAIVDAGHKPISSTDGMSLSRETSPIFEFWPQLVARDLADLQAAIAQRDFAALGRISERNAMAMHATTITADPPYTYWLPESISVMKRLWSMRRAGFAGYITMDAGPQVKALCLQQDVARLAEELGSVPGIKDVRVFGAGGAPEIIEEHLF